MATALAHLQKFKKGMGILNMKRIAACLNLALLSSLASVANASPLLDSIQASDQEAALELINEGADVNTAEVNGTTALHWAVHNGDLPVIKKLIKGGADVNAVNSFGASSVSEAAVLGNADIMKALLKAGADPESPNADGQTALMIVARSNNIETAKLLLKYDADVNAVEQWRGQGAVIFAAAQSQPEMLKLLLKEGGDPNARAFVNERRRMISSERRFQWRPVGGLTALIYAGREGCVECVRLLLDAGADIDQGDGENTTALLASIINLRFDTAKYLIEAGANVNKWTLRGENPVYSTVDVNTVPHGGYPDRPSTDATTGLEILQQLLEAGANPNLQLKLQSIYRQLKDDRGSDSILGIGSTPLLRAAKGHDAAAMKLLLEYGALPNLANNRGSTPVMAAAGLGVSATDTRGDTTTPLAGQNSREALEVLLAHGADIHATDNSGKTALHSVANWGWNEAVEFLIQQGADPEAEDRTGSTPLDIAMGQSNGRGAAGDAHPETAELILRLISEQSSQ